MLTIRRAVLAWLALAISVAADGQTLSLAEPSYEPQTRGSVTVRITNNPKPDPATFTDKAVWVVIARSEASPAGSQLAISGVATTQVYGDTGLIRISLAAPLPDDVVEFDVIAVAPKPVRVTWTVKKPQGGFGFNAVDKRDKSDVYIFGSLVSGVDVAPSYNVDLSLGTPVKEFAVRGAAFRASGIATLKSADHRTVDPDSYLVSAKVSRTYPIDLDDGGPYLDFAWEVARLEFSRKDEFSNVVTAPLLTYSRKLYVSLTERKYVKAAIDVELSGGIEAGRNLQSKLVPEGYGGILRLVPGLAAYASFPSALGFEEIRWTSTYRARVLAKAEAFTDLRDDDNPYPSVAKGTRHEWRDQLDLRLTPLLSLTVAHDFGSAPPAFKILNHRLTLGATMMWAWTK